MSAPVGLRRSDTAHSGRPHGFHTVDFGHVGYRCSIHRGRGCGPLGLAGAHREVADLIRCGEVPAVRGDERALHDTARRVVQTDWAIAPSLVGLP